MAFKAFLLNDEQSITIYKRRGARSLKLSVAPSGQVKVTIPTWVPYKAGLDFARSKHDWIMSQNVQPVLLEPGQAIGKAHHLNFIASESSERPSSRVTNNTVTVTHPTSLEYSDPAVQKIAQTASVKALRAQAEALLPQRLKILANQYGFSYNSVSVKRLKGRWGSCDQNRNIVLNLFLMQAPWSLIDYVLLHELTHTQILRHGPDFWAAMEHIMPNVKALKKQLRSYQPILNGEPLVAI